MKNTNTTILALLFMVLGVASRFITMLPNFSAVEAVALMGGAYIATRGIALIMPLVTLYLGDMVLNNTLYRSYFPQEEGLVLWSSYMTWNIASIVLITILGMTLLKKVNIQRVLGASLAGSVIFFLITNFGAWLNNPMYTQNFSGLMTSYAAGLPFLKNSAISALLFSSVLFGMFEVTKNLVADKLVAERS